MKKVAAAPKALKAETPTRISSRIKAKAISEGFSDDESEKVDTYLDFDINPFRGMLWPFRRSKTTLVITESTNGFSKTCFLLFEQPKTEASLATPFKA